MSELGPATHRSLWRRWLGYIVRLALGVLPLLWISRRIVLGDVIDEVQRRDPLGLAFAWLLLFMGIVIGAYRWRVLTLAYGGKDVPRVRTLTSILLVGAYFNMLPGGVAGEGIRALRMRPHLRDFITSFNTIVVERIAGLIALLTYAAVATLWLPPGDHSIVVRCFEIGIVFALFLATGTIILPYLVTRAPQLRHAIMRVPVVGKLVLKLPPAERPILIVASICLSLLTQGLVIGSILTVTHGMSADAPTAVVGVLPLIVLVTHIPLAPGGIGQREAAFVYFYGLVGVNATIAMGTSIIVFLISLSFSALGGFCYFVEPASSGRPGRQPRREGATASR